MSHQHFCHIEGPYWECDGNAVRADDAEPSVCMCLPCGRRLEGFDHANCGDAVELVACPKHHEEALRTLAVAREISRRRAAQFGLGEKCERMRSLPEGPEKNALTEEIKAWIVQNFDHQQPEV